MVDTLTEVIDALIDFGLTSLAQVIAATKIKVLLLRIDARNLCRERPRIPIHLRAYFLRDGTRHVTLQEQNISQFAVVSARPEVLVGCGIDQLRGNADV